MRPGSVQRHARASVALGVVLACTGAAAASGQGLDVVAGGLSNPRGIAFGPDGKLYVAESGRGGSGPCIAGPEGGPSCYGPTGAITRINVKSGKTRRIITGLPSHASQTGDVPGTDALGPNDVSFRGRTAYFTVGLGANPDARRQLGSGGRRFAALYRMRRNGRVRRIADLGAYEAVNNPDEGQPTAEVDTNPFSVDANGRGRILVTDAGGNALLHVSPSGSRVETLAVFPFGQTLAPPSLGLAPGAQVPYQPVPTAVVRAGGGAAYVGQLTGFPFPVGAASIFHVAQGSAPVVHATGFTNVVDLARTQDRALYVLQITTMGLAGPASPGKLVRVAADGTQTELAAGRLQHPTGIAVGKNGDLYVANNAGSPGNAEIVRISPGG